MSAELQASPGNPTPAPEPAKIVQIEPLTAKLSSTVDQNPHSMFLGISIRGWIAVLVIATVCGMSCGKIKIEEPLYTLATVVTGFYFGQNTKKVV